ncbi:MAG: radical SAM protein [Candidatus Omnitrophota bacterium]
MKYIYGPVHSRRLGFSLGVSLIAYKICSFDCVYCQLGGTTEKTTIRKEYSPCKDILGELNSWLKNNQAEAGKLDYITLAGSGEPTLNSCIGQFILEAKKLVSTPIAVITNSSLLIDPVLRKELKAADLIVPSLDAVDPRIFQAIDRPAVNIDPERIIDSMVSLKKEFSGKIWLEVMLVKGINDDLRHIRKIKEAVERIRPDKVQLNSPVRSASGGNILAVPKAKLEKIRKIIGDTCEIL